MSLMRRLLLVLAVVMAAAGMTGGMSTPVDAAPAATKAQFCARWTGVCGRVCRGPDCATCASLQSGCLADGCFRFRSGARCMSNAGDVALTDTRLRPNTRAQAPKRERPAALKRRTKN